MPTSIAFYRDALGFRVMHTSPLNASGSYGFVLLERDGIELMLNTAYDEGKRPAAPDPARVAAHRDTALYFGCPDVAGAYAHLRALGVAAKPPRVAHYGMNQLYVSDPDGYTVCLQWPAPSPVTTATSP
jgi:catechol 2,3-dioxygenase-like lactoylglutathione lyase family enzyme